MGARSLRTSSFSHKAIFRILMAPRFRSSDLQEHVFDVGLTIRHKSVPGRGPEPLAVIVQAGCSKYGPVHQKCLPQNFLSPCLVAKTGQGRLSHPGEVPQRWTGQQGTWSLFLPFWVPNDPQYLLPFPPHSWNHQVPEGALGLCLATVPAGAPGNRMAPTGRCSVNVPESSEMTFPV